MPKAKEEKVKKELNPTDYDDYGDYIAAKKRAGEVRGEEDAS